MTSLDTPSFNDTSIGEAEGIAGISTWTSLNYREGRPLSGAIYLNRTTNVLTGGSPLKSLRHGDF